MRLLTAWLVAFLFTVPRLALGQALKPTDLVGTWVHRQDGGNWSDSLKGQLLVTYLKVDPNGTYAYEGKIKKNDGEWHPWGVGWAKGSWALAADTLRFKDSRNSISYKVVLKDGQLLLWDWLMWDAGRHQEKCTEKAFERFDPSKPLTLPPPLQVTINPADLVGTWAGTFKTKYWGTVTDTLVISADRTLRSIHYGWPDIFKTRYNWDSLPGNKFTGTWPSHFWVRSDWDLLPGDEFTGAGLLGRYRVSLQNGELVPCSPARPVFKRVTP